MGAQRITNSDNTLREGDQSLACSLHPDGLVQVPRALGVAGHEAAGAGV